MRVTFIPKQPAPTKSGVYFARRYPGESILPVRVVADKYVEMLGSGIYHNISSFDAWFGPVPEVQEAST